MTTEERLYKLEGIVEGVMAVLPERVSALEHRMDLLRQEVKAEIAGLRQEVNPSCYPSIFWAMRPRLWARTKESTLMTKPSWVTA
jgi:hypothetical protein